MRGWRGRARSVREPWILDVPGCLVSHEEVIDAERRVLIEVRAQKARHHRPHRRAAIGLFHPTHAPPLRRGGGAGAFGRIGGSLRRILGLMAAPLIWFGICSRSIQDTCVAYSREVTTEEPDGA